MNGRYTFYKTLIVAFTLLALALLWQLAETVIVLVVAIIFASAIRPLVKRLTSWGLPQWAAILLVYLLIIGGLTGLLAVAIPPIYGVINNLLSDNLIVNRLTATLVGWAYDLGYTEFISNMMKLPKMWTEWRNQLGLQVEQMASENGFEILRDIATGLSQFLLALVMAFYWLTARDQIQGLMLSITPIRHRDQVEGIFNEVETTLGAYLRGTALLMASIGLSAFIGLVLLRVPYALALAVLAGLFEAIPMVGAALGALPAVLVGFSVSPTTGVLTILLFALIQFFENNVLVPRVMGRTVGLNPLLVIVAIVAGGVLNGMVGALLAIPVAGALQVIVRHLVLEPMQAEAKQRHEEGGVPVFEVEEKAEAPTDQGRMPSKEGKQKKQENGDILIARS